MTPRPDTHGAADASSGFAPLEAVVVLPATAAQSAPNRMPCFFTARSTSGLGGLIAIAGLIILASPIVALWRGVSVLVIPAAALSLAFLHWLIGVCAMPTMVCRLGLTLAVNVLSSLSILSALANIFWLPRNGNAIAKAAKAEAAGKKTGLETAYAGA
ncbi:MAG: DUF4418 family protein [Planctomycetota bacterium]|nr:DUF4418 family protein [Planctomycetota bacterium]